MASLCPLGGPGPEKVASALAGGDECHAGFGPRRSSACSGSGPLVVAFALSDPSAKEIALVAVGLAVFSALFLIAVMSTRSPLPHVLAMLAISVVLTLAIDDLARTIRAAAAGQRVVDPGLAAAAPSQGENPLTAREREVLEHARRHGRRARRGPAPVSGHDAQPPLHDHARAGRAQPHRGDPRGRGARLAVASTASRRPTSASQG